MLENRANYEKQLNEMTEYIDVQTQKINDQQLTINELNAKLEEIEEESQYQEYS